MIVEDTVICIAFPLIVRLFVVDIDSDRCEMIHILELVGPAVLRTTWGEGDCCRLTYDLDTIYSTYITLRGW